MRSLARETRRLGSGVRQGFLIEHHPENIDRADETRNCQKTQKVLEREFF
jgi:hypothetical protein